MLHFEIFFSDKHLAIFAREAPEKDYSCSCKDPAFVSGFNKPTSLVKLLGIAITQSV
jgi:hypothetical protein